MGGIADLRRLGGADGVRLPGRTAGLISAACPGCTGFQRPTDMVTLGACTTSTSWLSDPGPAGRRPRSPRPSWSGGAPALGRRPPPAGGGPHPTPPPPPHPPRAVAHLPPPG